jgi:hypothetical protein
MTRLAAFALLALIGAVANAQESQASAGAASSPATPSVDQQFSGLLREGKYLAAMNLIEGAEPGTVSDGLRSLFEQYRSMLDGFVVRNGDVTSPVPAAKAEDLAPYADAVPMDAIAAIVERARDTRVVIVNETHDNPRDRAFILAVAEALRPLGYSVYSAETLANQPPAIGAVEMERLTNEGYARRSSGGYTIDPMFAHLLRRVVALGYRPVGHEATMTPELVAAPREQQIAMREQGQAVNLANAIAAAGPDAKFLVHVGYSHAAEEPLGPTRQEWMALRLKRLTGIDPLTVDQTWLSEFALPALHAALAPRVGDAPKVFGNNGQPVRRGPPGAFDLEVVHPPIRTVGGRPDWLQNTGRHAVAIPTELLPREGRRLVQAFAAGEPDDAVPLDQAIVTAGQEPPVIYVLPEGEVRWAVQDE